MDRVPGCIGDFEVPGLGCAVAGRLLDKALPESAQAPFRINGFEEEIEETLRCVRAGLMESARMPHDATLAIVGWLDLLRRQLGVRYPFESRSPACIGLWSPNVRHIEVGAAARPGPGSSFE